MSTPPNCPILVNHLNNLLKKGGPYSELAHQLIMILDDVEGIADLIDHEFPAERHAFERASHIFKNATELQANITHIGTAEVLKKQLVF